MKRTSFIFCLRTLSFALISFLASSIVTITEILGIVKPGVLDSKGRADSSIKGKTSPDIEDKSGEVGTCGAKPQIADGALVGDDDGVEVLLGLLLLVITDFLF